MTLCHCMKCLKQKPEVSNAITHLIEALLEEKVATKSGASLNRTASDTEGIVSREVQAGEQVYMALGELKKVL